LKNLAVNSLVLILLALTAACGWQMRGAPSLPPEMSIIYIDARDPYGPFARELRRMLDSGDDARVTWEREEATAIVRIRQASSSREILSVNLAGRPEEQRVTYRVEFDVRDAEGNILIDTQRMSLNRDISTDPDDALGARQEANRVARSLEEEIVQSVVLRIEALAANYQPPPDTRTYSQVIHIDGPDPDSALVQALYRLLDRDKEMGISRVEEGASLRLRLISSDRGNQVLARDEQGRPQTIRVDHEVVFDVLTPEGEVRLGRERLHLDRNIQIDPEDPLDVQRQTRRLSESLQQDIVQSINERLKTLID